jgi:uncharacterized protein (DUF736 family)
MKSRVGVLAAIAAAGLALVPTVLAGASTSLTITTPKQGQSFALHNTSYIPVAGTVSFAPATQSSTTFFLRRDACGTSDDNPHLSVTKGTDAGDGCGLTLTSIVGLGGTVDQAASVDFPTEDGMPLTLDTSRNVTGTIDLESFALAAGTGLGAGDLTVDISLEALVGGNGVDIGSTSQTVVITPVAANYPVQFTIQPNAALSKTDLSGVDLRVHVEGPFVFSGFIGNSGASWVALPSYTASLTDSVQISIDDPTFANPIPARIFSTSKGTQWSVAIPTPAVGKHTIYAESQQGFTTSAVVARQFNVTK